jgi:hypothetical protein
MLSSHTSTQQAAAPHERPGELPRVLVGLIFALACLVTVCWWATLFVLMRWLISAAL